MTANAILESWMILDRDDATNMSWIESTGSRTMVGDVDTAQVEKSSSEQSSGAWLLICPAE